LVAVDEETGERDRAGDADRRAPPEERRDRPGQRARSQRQQPQPDGVAGRHLDRDLVLGQRCEPRIGGQQRHEQDDTSDGQREEVRGQLLESDPATRQAGRREELHAAAA
jgi:hypothetical protein